MGHICKIWKNMTDSSQLILSLTLLLGEDRPLVKEDFSSKINDRLDILNRLYALVHSVPSWLPGLGRNQTGKKKFLVPLLLLCGENVQSALWTNSKIIQTSYLILSTLKKDVFKAESVSEIFNKDEVYVYNLWNNSTISIYFSLWLNNIFRRFFRILSLD